MTGAREDRHGLVRRALSGHAAIGLLAGALIYVIALSGSIVVIHDRWQRWEQPNIPEATHLSPAAAQAAMAHALASERGRTRTSHLYIRMPTGDLPRAAVTTDHAAWYVDGQGRIAGREAHAWTEFVIGLHEYLSLPTSWGMILVGGLGIALFALALTGLLAHPRLVRDAFRLRARQDPRIARTDWHNRLGVWTLPWVLAVTLTGAFIGLSNVGATLLASAYAGGDVEKVYAPIFGREPRADAAEASLPDIAAALAALAERMPKASPSYVIVHDPGTRGQHVQVIAEHRRRLIYGETYQFDSRGRWLGPVGLSDGAIGQQATASAYNLHFGNYGGLAVEIAYMLLGLCLCVVTATGTSLWLRKRERRGQDSRRLAACWDVVIWGTPLALVAMAWLRALAGAEAPLAAGFWGALAAGTALAAAMPSRVSGEWLRSAVCLSVMATGLFHLIALRPQAKEVIAIDILAILLAAAALRAQAWAASRSRPAGGTRPGRAWFGSAEGSESDGPGRKAGQRR